MKPGNRVASDAMIDQFARNRIEQMIGLQHDGAGGTATGFGQAH